MTNVLWPSVGADPKSKRLTLLNVISFFCLPVSAPQKDFRLVAWHYFDPAQHQTNSSKDGFRGLQGTLVRLSGQSHLRVQGTCIPIAEVHPVNRDLANLRASLVMRAANFVRPDVTNAAHPSNLVISSCSTQCRPFTARLRL